MFLFLYTGLCISVCILGLRFLLGLGLVGIRFVVGNILFLFFFGWGWWDVGSGIHSLSGLRILRMPRVLLGLVVSFSFLF